MRMSLLLPPLRLPSRHLRSRRLLSLRSTSVLLTALFPTLFLTLFLTLVLALAVGSAAAQDASGDPLARVLRCNVDGHVPDGPARAEEGGYRFEYQSLRGRTDDDRSCTVYRIRNTPGKPPTPFYWRMGDETLVDKARLDRCGDGAQACPWLAFARYFPGPVDANLSTLSYGLNADAYHAQTETFMTTVSLPDRSVAEDAGILASSVGTELAGTFVDEAGTAYELHLLAKSRFEPAERGGYRLIYELDDLGGSGLFATDAVRVQWDALDGIPAVAAARAGDAPGAIDRGPDHLYLTVRADDFALDDRFLLRVVPAAGGPPLATVEMPAYAPVTAD